MEKDFDELNYYEMLDIKPDATALEIRSAYNAALQMYQSDSLVSYSFFSTGRKKSNTCPSGKSLLHAYQ